MFSWERNQIPNLVDSVRITALLLKTAYAVINSRPVYLTLEPDG